MKKDSLKIIIVIILIGLISFTFSYFLYIENTKEKEKIITLEDKYEFIIHDLPTNIDQNKRPIMYDFLYGTLGNNSNVINESRYYAIMVRNEYIEKSDTGIIYISEYNDFEQYPMPALGTGYTSLTLNSSDWTRTVNLFKNWPEDKKFKELDYTMFILPINDGEMNPDIYEVGVDSKYRLVWNEIPFYNIFFKDSWIHDNIGSLGYETKWLRKDPYKSLIKESGINIDSKFFDNHNLYKNITIYEKNNNYNSFNLTIIGENYFRVTTQDGIEKEYSLEDLIKNYPTYDLSMFDNSKE